MILDIFYKGEEAIRAQHEAAESEKLHVLRGGSAGCLLEDNTTIGCPHTALARYMGFNLDSSMSQGYFDGGIGNEAIWERNIKASGVPFKVEEEIPVRYQLDGTHLITGRPDMVIGTDTDGAFTPTYGVELKGAFALDSAADRLFGLKPDAKHLCQAGFYMLAMDLPWSLVYSCNITGDMSYFRKKEYGESKLPLGKVEFMLEYQGDTLFYKDPLTGNMVRTIITKEGILNFYRLVVDMFQSQEVGLTKMAGKGPTGDNYPWDPNLYNDLTLMVPINQGWEAFVEYCGKASTSELLIRYSKGKYLVHKVRKPKGLLYRAEMNIIGKCNTVGEARRLVYAA